MTTLLLGGLALPLLAAPDGAAPRITAEIARYPALDDETHLWRVAVLVRGAPGDEQEVALRLAGEGILNASVTPKKAVVSDREPGLFYVEAETPSGLSAQLSVGLEGSDAATTIQLPADVIDLRDLSWEAWHVGDDAHIDPGLVPPSEDAGDWHPVVLPRHWDATGLTWLRSRVSIPKFLRGKGIAVVLGGVAHEDIVSLNGVEIGRGAGWNARREYVLPDRVTRWGAENDLLIAVDSQTGGAGFLVAPLAIAPQQFQPSPPLFPAHEPMDEMVRATPGPIGDPLPLRPIEAQDGVLRYSDSGDEVALYGVNYYPPTRDQWISFGKLSDQDKRDVEADFDDLVRMGVNVIRFHVFDTEISDGEGNLVENEYLDKWDYMVALCSEKDLYLMLTPIAVFGGRTGTRADSFSVSIPRPSVVMWEETWAAQTRFTTQLLTRVNPYTSRRLADEPCVALIEIVNEPDYWDYTEVTEGNPRGSWLAEEANRKAMAGVQGAWNAFVPSPEWRSQATFSVYRYQTVRRYIDGMVAAIRNAGAKQPIAHNRYWHPWPDVHQAIADSRCDAITFGCYANSLAEQDPSVGDGTNQLDFLRAWLNNSGYESCYARKARAVYEFDPATTLEKIHMYPAMAKQFRHRGAQIACQFQYDPKTTAHANLAWWHQYLNLWHSPERMVSYLIGAEVFRRLPRGATFPIPEDDWVFPPAAISYARNAALLCAGDCYMQARPTEWSPLALPASPDRILSVGTCPYFEYEGTGIVDIRVHADTMSLRIYPDVLRLRTALHGTDEDPLTRLEYGSHTFVLKLSDWEAAELRKRVDEGWEVLPWEANAFEASPGEYELRRGTNQGQSGRDAQ